MPITYRPLAYTSPSGQRIEFTYDGKIEDGVTHNLGEFQFSGVDGKYYQDRSLTTDPYTFNLLFNNQEDLSTARELLSEKRTDTQVGMLEHPDPTLPSGTFPVVVSSFKPTQNSVKKVGVIAMTVTFFKTIENLLGGDPVDVNNPSSGFATLNTIENLNIQQATDFAESVNLETGSGFASLVEKSRAAIVDLKDGLGFIAAQVDSVNILFTTGVNEFLSEVDELARSPFDLARRIQNLIQLPMLAIADGKTRIAAYRDYVESVLGITEDDKQEFSAGSPSGINILSVAGLASLASISAISYSAVSTPSVTLDEIISGEVEQGAGTTTTAEQLSLTETGTVITEGYLSRPQIIETIQSVLNSAVETTEILSEGAANFGASTFFTQYFDYSILNKNLIASTVGNLNKRIFNTSREISFITEIELDPIQWCAQLYKSVENNTINFFIASNKLHGDEIFIVPKGREVIYYV